MKLPDNFQMREHSWPCRFHIKNDRESLLEEIFGDEGLINADDIVCFAPPIKAANKSPNTFCPFPFFPC